MPIYTYGFGYMPLAKIRNMLDEEGLRMNDIANIRHISKVIVEILVSEDYSENLRKVLKDNSFRVIDCFDPLEPFGSYSEEKETEMAKRAINKSLLRQIEISRDKRVKDFYRGLLSNCNISSLNKDDNKEMNIDAYLMCLNHSEIQGRKANTERIDIINRQSDLEKTKLEVAYINELLPCYSDGQRC